MSVSTALRHPQRMKRKSPKAAEQAAPAIAVAGVSPVTGDTPMRGEAKHRAASGTTGVFHSRIALRCLSSFVREATGVTVGVLVLAAAAHAGDASGEFRYPASRGPVTVTLHHAYLVTGPDATGQAIRQLVLSEQDLASAIAGCDRLGCVSGQLGSGATVDFDAGPRLNTWFVANDQRLQHSDTALPATMVLKDNSARHLAGQWNLSGGVGPTGSVQFDAPLAKAFSKY